jgi:hypothetical protein
MLRFLPIPEKIVVLSETSLTLRSSLEEEVDEVWKAARDRCGSTLFDGPIFSLEEISPRAISGRYVGYRFFVAQEHRPELFAKLLVQPLAVTGILQNLDGLFLGYRNSSVALQSDCWEFIPSGGVDRSTLTEDGQLHALKQVFAELSEEVGIGSTAVAPPKLLLFTEDPLHHIFDLIWELKTSLDRNAVFRAHAALLRPEHSKIRFVRWTDIEGFLSKEGDSVLPATRDLLVHLLENR